MLKNSHWRILFCVLWVCGFILTFLNPANAKCYALIVVIWDYPDQRVDPNKPPISLKLDGPQNDLYLIKSMLEAYGIKEEDTVIITNEKATKKGIQQAFESLSKRLESEDKLLFYFSGHGVHILDGYAPAPDDEKNGRYPDKNDEALVLWDTDLRSPETYLLDDDINLLLQQIKTKTQKITCIIDTCYSGDVLKDIRLGKVRGCSQVNTSEESAEQSPPVINAQDILDKATDDFALLFAASSYNQRIQELKVFLRGHYAPIGPLTYSLYRQAMQDFSLSCRTLIERIKNDHKLWKLPWEPVLEGPENRFDEIFLEGATEISTPNNSINLKTEDGSAREFRINELIAAGGIGRNRGLLRNIEKQRRAVIIGVNSNPLKYAENDAEEIAAVFQEAGYMVTLMTPDKVLQPTRDNIIEQLEQHSTLEGIELLLVYLSGHGNEDSFIAMNSEMLSLKEDLFRAISNAKADKRVIIVDACRVAPNREFTQRFLQYGTTTDSVFTACDADQVAPEIEQFKHGLFTYFLLKGLRGIDDKDRGAATSDRIVTLLGLVDYTMRSIEKWQASHPHSAVGLTKITTKLVYLGDEILLLNQDDVERVNPNRPPSEEVPPGGIVVDKKYQDDLNNGHITEDFRRELESKNILLSGNVQIKNEGNRWLVIDRVNRQVYPVSKEEDNLNIYPPQSIDIRDAPKDTQGRLYVYKDLEETTLLPFIPYGWMWGNALGRQGFDANSVTQMIRLNMSSTENVYNDQITCNDNQGTCIQFHVTWQNQTWIAVGFISGPDEPAWWGESNHAWYYDLSGLERKRLVFHARSPLPGVRIQVKVGILYDKLWGDSLRELAITKWYKLSPQWTRYELDLSNHDLSYVCNGFTVVVEKKHQDNPNATVQFFLDEIYFESLNRRKKQ